MIGKNHCNSKTWANPSQVDLSCGTAHRDFSRFLCEISLPSPPSTLCS